jgi:hypothetical protein
MNFIESIKNLCFVDFPVEDLTPEQAKLRLAYKAFLECDEPRAETLARELCDEAITVEVKDAAVSLLFALLLWQDRFDELAQFGIPRNADDAEQIAAYDTRQTEILLSDEPSMMDMPDCPLIQPIMTVGINGERVDMLVDTGAMITTITESVAKRSNVGSVGETVQTTGSTSVSVETQVARIGELTIGNTVFKNKQCIIMPDNAMDFCASGGPKINGTVGWEVIKQLYWEIDYANRKILVRAPKRKSGEHNMCCAFFPMVRALLGNNAPIVIGLDTGANSSDFGKCMVGIFADAQMSQQSFGGAGQVEKIKSAGYEVPEIPLLIGNARVVLKDAFIHAEREWNYAQFLISPGNLGSDIAAGKTLVIDYANRRLEIR